VKKQNTEFALLLKSLGPRWENIDMPMEGREAGGIAKEQKNRTPEPRYLGQDGSTELTDQGYQRELDSGWVQIDRRVPSGEVREQWMFDKVMKEVRGAESVIVICGILHSKQLAERFRRDSRNLVEIEFRGLKRRQ
jgi:hypothetical protein